MWWWRVVIAAAVAASVLVAWQWQTGGEWRAAGSGSEDVTGFNQAWAAPSHTVAPKQAGKSGSGGAAAAAGKEADAEEDGEEEAEGDDEDEETAEGAEDGEEEEEAGAGAKGAAAAPSASAPPAAAGSHAKAPSTPSGKPKPAASIKPAPAAGGASGGGSGEASWRDGVFLFEPLAGPSWLATAPFVGTPRLHMSRRACVGDYTSEFWVGNRSCLFKNLYFWRGAEDLPGNSWENHMANEHHGHWTYFHAVPAADVASGAWDTARDFAPLQERIRAEVKVDLLSWVLQYTDWHISVAVFAATPLTADGAEPAPAALLAPGAEALTPGQLVSHWRRGKQPRPAVLHPLEAEGATARWLGNASAVRELAGGRGEFAPPPPAQGELQWLPPGVHHLAARSFFLQYRANMGNVGHSLWDDIVPFMGASRNLGLCAPGDDEADPLSTGGFACGAAFGAGDPDSPRALAEFDLLLTDVGKSASWELPGGPEPKLPSVRTLLTLASPGGAPYEIALLKRDVGDALVLFETVAGGVTGMSPHSLSHTLMPYGALEPGFRPTWRMRRHIMRRANFSEEDIMRPAASLVPPDMPPGKKWRLTFIQSKRPVWDFEALLARIAAAYPTIHVDGFRWEDKHLDMLGEVRVLSQTHIFIASDGTACMTSPFLPIGSVFIDLGIPRPWGSQVKGDFLSSIDYARVLFYGELEPLPQFGGNAAVQEQTGDEHAGMKIPFEKLQPYLDKALGFLEKGFPVPVPGRTNFAPATALLSHILDAFPEFGTPVIMRNFLVNGYDFKAAGKYKEVLPALYAKHVGRPAPPALAAEIAAFCARQQCDNPG